jgi:putative ABC transport system permease protein
MSAVRPFNRIGRIVRRGGAPFLVAVLMMAVALGATTAIFSVVHAVLLRPLPFSNPDGLVMLWGRDNARSLPVIEVSLGDLRTWRSQNTTLSAIEIFGSVNWSYRITAPGEPFTATYSAVSGSFFETVGARPLLGRTLAPADDQPGAPGRIVMSDDLWRRRFSADPRIVGRAITIGEGADAQPFEVVGVMEPGFRFPNGAELWTPATRDIAEYARRSKDGTDRDGLRVFYAVGRLKDGVTLDRARAELSTIARRAEIGAGKAESRVEMVVTPFEAYFFGAARPALRAMFGAVAGLLLIACANAAGLLLVQGVAREREIATRLALGAGRSEIVRQFLWEALLMASLAGILGAGLAVSIVKGFVALTPPDVPRLDQISINTPVLLFAAVVTLALPFLVGMLPAWQLSRGNPGEVLKQTLRAGAPRTGQLRRLLVVAQLAAALVLLIAAGLLAKSFVGLMRVDFGFDPHNVLTFDLYVPESKYATLESERALAAEVVGELERLPGVLAAGAIFQRPFANGPIGMDTGFILDGQPRTRETWTRNPLLNWEAVTPGYFKAMGIRLTRGRMFTDHDDEHAPFVALVSEAMAVRVWPGHDPLGRRLRAYGALDPEEEKWQTVIGVVENVHYREVHQPRLDLYVPNQQAPASVKHYMVKTSGDPLSTVAAIQQAVKRLDPAVGVEKVTTMEQIVAGTVAPSRFNMFIFVAFSGIALAFAAIGLSAVVAYVGRQRTHEMGIRISLGADRRHVVRLLVTEGVYLAIAGLAIGLPCAWAITRLLSALLFEVPPTDRSTFVGITGLVLVVSFIASYLPARRIARLNPVTALKSE